MFNLGVQVGSSYILVVVSGAGGADELQSMNVFTAGMIEHTGRRRLLLDSLAFESTLGADAAAKQAVIAHMKATIPQLERVAVLVRQGARRGLVSGASERGDFLAAEFDDIVEAEKWLQKP